MGDDAKYSLSSFRPLYKWMRHSSSHVYESYRLYKSKRSIYTLLLGDVMWHISKSFSLLFWVFDRQDNNVSYCNKLKPPSWKMCFIIVTPPMITLVELKLTITCCLTCNSVYNNSTIHPKKKREILGIFFLISTQLS